MKSTLPLDPADARGFGEGNHPSLDDSLGPVEPSGEGKPPSSDAFVGRTIDGKYEVVSFLAKGGMGRVYVAVEIATGRLVALKVLTVDASDPMFRRRFFNEAAMAASLSHPNVVAVLGFGVDDDSTCYIVMELLEGETLNETCKRQQRLSLLLALNISRQVCAALKAAHGSGFVHRDLKPLNLFVVGDPEAPAIKVLDFGLAKRLSSDSSLTQTGSFLGSPTYMSPEQITGAEVTVAADLYNTGLVLYRMLVGRPPFVGDISSAVLVDHATKAPPAFRAVAPDLLPMPEVEWVVMRCLEKVPRHRFASVAELDRALEACERLARGEIASLELRFDNHALVIDDGGRTFAMPMVAAAGVGRSWLAEHLPWVIAAVGFAVGLMGLAGVLIVLAAWLAFG